MNLLDVIRRIQPAAPWAEGDNIPWDEPAFSERMLAEHLNQDHDLASRRQATIDRHVEWICDEVIGDRSLTILDLACGPGLYLERLARRGFHCVGIDFSPASIAHAKKTVAAEKLDSTFEQADLRRAEFGSGFGLATLLYGQLNVFRRDEAASILTRARAALEPGGQILLEVQRFEKIKNDGSATTSWYGAPQGLFSDRPHLVLQEGSWDEEARTRTERFFVIDAETGEVSRHALSNEAYREDELATMLAEAGFGAPVFYPSLLGVDDPDHAYNQVLLASVAS